MLEEGPPPENVERLFRADAFEVAELMVHPAARGYGPGRRLLAAGCGPWPTCWLSTQPDVPAAAVYRHLGWQPFGRFVSERHGRLEVYLRHHGFRQCSMRC